MDDILKALGVGKEIGTEETAQKLWMNFLGQFGFEPLQAFPDNMTKGTDRILGNPKLGRKTSIVHHIFNPKFITYTYADLESGIPLYTRTVGKTKGDLALWAGIVGMRDVAGNRFPKKDNPKRTKIRRKTKEGRSTVKEMIRAVNILDRQGAVFSGEKPPNNWHKGMSNDEQEDYLEENYPDYHTYLIENLHQPLEAHEFLDQLNVTKDRAAFVRKVEKLIKDDYPGLFQKVLDDAVALDNHRWQLVIIANSSLIPEMEERGFMNLDANYDAIINSGKTSAYVKEALQNTRSDSAKLSEKSVYLIRAPDGADVKKSNWKDELKGERKMFDRIKKAMNVSWYDILRKAPEYEPTDDDDDDAPKKKKVKQKNPQKEDTIEERQVKYTDKIREPTDRYTGLHVDFTDPEGLGHHEMPAKTDPCCGKLKGLIKSYIEHEDPRNWEYDSEDILHEISQLDCSELTASLAHETPITVAGYAIDQHQEGFLKSHVGKGEIPTGQEEGGAWKQWDATKQDEVSKTLRNGTILAWYEHCLKRRVANPKKVPTGKGHEEAYEDTGMTPAQTHQAIKDMGGNPLMPSPADKEKLRQIGTADEGGKADITHLEMTHNERLNQKIMDYEDEMNLKRRRPKGPQERHLRDMSKFKNLRDTVLSTDDEETILWTKKGHVPSEHLKEWMTANGYRFEEKEISGNLAAYKTLGLGPPPVLQDADKYIDGVPEIKRYLERTGVGKGSSGGTKT